jgi:hypothetical protein
MMNESNTRKQDGDESFDLTEWLSNDVKLPQYRDAFLEHGFESPLECSTVDETALDALGVVKIGHRRRLLVSCKKLADKCGLSSQDLARPEKCSNISSEAKDQQTNSNNVQPPENLELAPVLPPKKGKKSRPAPPARNMAEQEVNMDSAIQGENSNVSAESHDNLRLEVSNSTNPNSNLLQTENVKPTESINAGEDTIHESTDTETILSPGLPPGNEILEYEPIWEASEGEPLPLSPVKQTDMRLDNQTESVDNNANLDINTAEKTNINNDQQNKQINEQVKLPNSSKSVSEPPPIPPRADLEDLIEEKHPSTGIPNAAPETTEPKPALEESKPPQEKVVTPKKKIAPVKPPRIKRGPAVSMHIPDSQPLEFVPQPRRSVGSIDQTVKYQDGVIYENEVFTNDQIAAQQVEKRSQSTGEKRSVVDPVAEVPEPNDGNVYGNVENLQKAPLKPTMSAPESLKAKKPKPSPRVRTMSKEKPKEAVYDAPKDAVYETVSGKKYICHIKKLWPQFSPS